MPREKPLTSEDLTRPPIRRWPGPIVDSHTHTGSVAASRLLFEIAESYGVALVLGITHAETIPPLAEAFGDRYRPIVWVEHDLLREPDRFAETNVARIREAHARGAVAGKFWYTPRFWDETHFRFDAPALRPIFEVLVELGMPALVHVSDPDCWFATRYSDRERYRTKLEQYEQLEGTLAAMPDLNVLGAHFGGDPEHLDHLRDLLAKYPNYYIDSSATKWIVRELSVQPDAARNFVLEHADRIVFGSDIVAFDGATPADYQSRYWAHRWLWEGEGRRDSPIPDPCAPWPTGPIVEGLNLPDEVLAKLYVENARRLFHLDV
jgi:hypothetical protein